MQRILLLFLLLLCSSLFLCAQTTRTLSGIVKDADNGETLPFANILIKNSSTGTTSNVDGYFTLLDVPANELILEVNYVGYETMEVSIKAGIQSLSGLLVELSSGVNLTEVTVQANAYKVMSASKGISTISMSPAQLKTLPSFGEVDIFRSLQLLPGISGTNESSSGLFVRGGTPDQNLVLFDGMTVYNVDHFFGFFSAFNADAVKDVQLYKSAFPAKYGGRLSSVVDLTGKTGNPTQWHGNFGLNLLNAKATLQIPLFKKGSLLISGRRSYTDIIRSGLYDKIFGVFNQGSQADQLPQGRGGNLANLDIETVEPDFFFFDLNSKLSFQPTEKDVISLSAYSGQDNLVEENNAIREIAARGRRPARTIKRDLEESSVWGNRGLSGKWSRQWNPRWYSNIMVAYSNYKSKYNRALDVEVKNTEADTSLFNFGNTSLEDNNVRDITIRLDNEVQLNARHKLDFGVWGTQAKVDFLFTRNDTLSILDRKQEANYAAFYVQDNWTPTDKLQFNIGLRSTYYDISKKIYWSPRVNATWQLIDKIKLKAAFGRHYQFVNRIVNENVTEGSRDFWLLADDDLVKVSRADHYVVGAAFENNNFVFDVEAYYKDLSNLSEFSLRFRRNNTEQSQLFFSGNGYARGLEFLIQKKTGAYTGWLSYSLAEVRNQFPDLNDGLEFPALHDQRHEFKMVHSYELKRWTFALTWIYGSGKPYTEPDAQYTIELLDGSENGYISVGAKNGVRLPAYHRMDLSAHLNFNIKKTKIDLGLSIFNLYGRRNVWYREFDFSDLPPLVSEITYLGFTPNVSLDVSF